MAEVRSGLSIATEGLRHVYPGGTVALDGVDLNIGTGLFGLLGPNGAGKSTMMRILCTLLVPTDGTARVGDYDVVRQRLEVRRLLGYLPQEFGAWRLHRVEEALDTLALLSGLHERARRRERVRAVLEQVGLEEVASRKIKKLSGGMVRRLGVAQALVHEPQVLIVDEPTVGLDPQERLRFRQLMAKLAQDRVIVLSTHIVSDLASACRDLAIIDSGKIVFRGEPSELLTRARGMVFELTVPTGQAEPENMEVISRTSDAGGTRIQAVTADGSPPAGAVTVEEPSLEAGYLAFMASRGRAAAAVVEEEEVA